jgi:hypothetical protein
VQMAYRLGDRARAEVLTERALAIARARTPPDPAFLSETATLLRPTTTR